MKRVVIFFDSWSNPQTVFFALVLEKIHIFDDEKDPENARPNAKGIITGLYDCLERWDGIGFVHNDMKPENVGFPLDGGNGMTKLISFFLSKFEQGVETSWASFTSLRVYDFGMSTIVDKNNNSGTVLLGKTSFNQDLGAFFHGTPGYANPEMLVAHLSALANRPAFDFDPSPRLALPGQPVQRGAGVLQSQIRTQLRDKQPSCNAKANDVTYGPAFDLHGAALALFGILGALPGDNETDPPQVPGDNETDPPQVKVGFPPKLLQDVVPWEIFAESLKVDENQPDSASNSRTNNPRLWRRYRLMVGLAEEQFAFGALGAGTRTLQPNRSYRDSSKLFQYKPETVKLLRDATALTGIHDKDLVELLMIPIEEAGNPRTTYTQR
ncbi:unnamed protein product [Amoebophrya sp. A120]|nr:unnamed protein product [Amoebophrya sp. A120]|eukprot:GSA120T00004632001.1